MDISLTQLDARLDGIAHVLRDRRLRVPKYQRSYAWGAEQINTFWEDLRSALLSATPSYFLGTIVLSSEGDARESIIIDGQQRLATAAILIAAIRDHFADADDDARAQALQSQFLTYRDLKLGGETSRLTMNSNDAEFFSASIAGKQQTDEPSGASTRRLWQAYNLLREKVEEEAVAAKSNWQERLFRWAEFLEYEVRTIVVDVPTSSDAFLIFETLNDRGLPLTIADLLKNYLYGISDDRVDAVESAWETTVATLESPEDEQRLLDFLRQYWSSWYGAVRERDLYRSFRLRVRSEAQALELADKLAWASPNFLALAIGDASLWPEQTITQEEADTLYALQLSQNRPLLLAAMDHFPPEELSRLARATVSWLVRGIVVGGIGGGTTERYFCDAAVRVREGKVRTTEQVLEVLGDIVPTDEQFRRAAALMNAPRARLTRYLLLAFERYVGESERPGVVPQEFQEQCYVHRVLPRGATGDWSGFEELDMVDWSRRLGNFVLLERGAGVRTVDRTWLDVRMSLATSKFVTSSALRNVDDWTPEAIEARQSKFADAAPAIWPRRQ